ncbi:hypothetical protein [Methylomonas sp. 11b]|uniref:hypothetical protein n=1 Tax=Methylomonas sp. 11b TaxID=1168169 RepID=UPI0018CBFC2E|nr:hypothetical protein [Methylomonas sp. 11b]
MLFGSHKFPIGGDETCWSALAELRVQDSRSKTLTASTARQPLDTLHDIKNPRHRAAAISLKANSLASDRLNYRGIGNRVTVSMVLYA